MKTKIETEINNIETVESKIENITNNIDENGYSEVRKAVIDHDFELNNENKIEKVNEEIKKLEIEVLKDDIESKPAQVILDDVPKVEIPDISHLLTPDRETEKKDPMEGYRPVQFDLEEIQNIHRNLRSVYTPSNKVS